MNALVDIIDMENGEFVVSHGNRLALWYGWWFEDEYRAAMELVAGERGFETCPGLVAPRFVPVTVTDAEKAKGVRAEMIAALNDVRELLHDPDIEVRAREIDDEVDEQRRETARAVADERRKTTWRYA